MTLLPQTISENSKIVLDDLGHCFIWKCHVCEALKIGALLGGENNANVQAWRECVSCGRFCCDECTTKLNNGSQPSCNLCFVAGE